MHTDEHRLNSITETVIGCAYRVLNKLGCGFLEKVYENSLAYEIRNAGLEVQQQYPILIRYEGVVVGEYIADLLVERIVVVEVKAVKALDDIHKAQCINYLKATGLPVCLLMNFGGTKFELKRLMGPSALNNESESV